MICEVVRSWISGKEKRGTGEKTHRVGRGMTLIKPLAVPLQLGNSRSPAGLLWQGDAVRCSVFHARSTLTKDQILGMLSLATAAYHVGGGVGG